MNGKLVFQIALRVFVCALVAAPAAWSGDTPASGAGAAFKVTGRPVPPGSDLGPSLRVDSKLVIVPVSVFDPRNRFVPGLDRGHFKVFEDKVEQRISHFSSEDAPVSVGIVFDTSGSMASRLAESREALQQFFKVANPEDEFLLITVGDRPELVSDFTSDVAALQNHILFQPSNGRTALLDGIYLAAHEMRRAHRPRKAILVISDGGDNSSRYNRTETVNAMLESDVQVFSIRIGSSDASDLLSGLTEEERAGPKLLSSLAEETGGRHFDARNTKELSTIASHLGSELRTQYLLAYVPTNSQRDGKYRRVRVTLVNPPVSKLKVHSRLGYYAPAR